MADLSRRSSLLGIAALAGTSALSGCGYILYPERRGQSAYGTQLDPVVIILDGILVLFGVVPGLIAFAIDISSGCIYMSSSSGEPPNVAQSPARRLRRFRTAGRRQRDFEDTQREASGMAIRLDDPRLLYVTDPLLLDAGQLDALLFDHTHAVPASKLQMTTGADGELTGFGLIS